MTSWMTIIMCSLLPYAAQAPEGGHVALVCAVSGSVLVKTETSASALIPFSLLRSGAGLDLAQGAEATLVFENDRALYLVGPLQWVQPPLAPDHARILPSGTFRALTPDPQSQAGELIMASKGDLSPPVFLFPSLGEVWDPRPDLIFVATPDVVAFRMVNPRLGLMRLLERSNGRAYKALPGLGHLLRFPYPSDWPDLTPQPHVWRVEQQTQSGFRSVGVRRPRLRVEKPADIPADLASMVDIRLRSQQGQHLGALVAALELWDQNPSTPSAFLVAETLFEMGELAAADLLLDPLVEADLSPMHRAKRNQMLAHLARRLGRNEEADRYQQQALKDFVLAGLVPLPDEELNP